MEFKGQGRPLSEEGMDEVCESLSVTESEIWAVLTVETRGFGFFQDRRPQILFERHVFSRLTDGKFDSADSNVSSKRPGGYIGGANEYERLEKAMTFDQEAALQSASWGIGQIMGFNHKVAGFDTVEALVSEMVRNEDSQLLAMAKFIKGNNLAGPLRRCNWSSFARGYNGRDFKRNEYDSRLAAAYAKYHAILPDLTLRTAQCALLYLGFNPGPIDGLRGRLTRSALVQFQEGNNLPETGELDQGTESKLFSTAFPV